MTRQEQNKNKKVLLVMKMKKKRDELVGPWEILHGRTAK